MKEQPRHLFERASREGWAIGAFNAANMETVQAIIMAAAKLEAPVIIESSPGETAYAGPRALRSLVDVYAEQHGVTAFLNLDHAVTLAEVTEGIAADYDLVHFDGGKLEIGENIETTQTIVNNHKQTDQMVEAELEHIAGSSADHRGKSPTSLAKEIIYSDVERIEDFVAKTNVDTVAVSIGNVHGLYSKPPELDFDRLKDIHDTVKVFLSLHGGSGIRDRDVKAAIERGITKVNVNSELRVAFRESLEKALKDSDETAIYKLMPPVIEAMQKVVEKKIKLFGSAGKAKRQWSRRVIA